MKDFLKIGDSEYRVEANWNAIAGFCRKKGAFFSRNYKVGEGTRIAPDQRACPEFEPAEKPGD